MKLAWVISLLLLSACGPGGTGVKTETKSAKFSYDFTENGCKTQKQSANSVDGICRKLEDHALNNYCAYGLRSEEFKRYNCFAVLGNRPTSAEVEF